MPLGESRQRRPSYDDFTDHEATRAAAADRFARQVLATTRPWLPKPVHELDVLDLGSGYGHTGAVLARSCRSVVGVEPAAELHEKALVLAQGSPNLDFRHGTAEELSDAEAFDLVVLDNVYEHLPDQPAALRRVSAALRPGGVLYLLTPNRLWPVEAHYKLPFLSWLPLPVANTYLRLSGRGRDYTDASYAPTLWGLRRTIDEFPELTWRLTLPGDPRATKSGAPLHYRMGLGALARFPSLWVVSKAFMVVARKATA